MKTKSKYTMTKNIAWMIGNAWRICKSVLTLCVLCAAAAVAVNLTELFVAPQILSKVEQAAPVAELIGTILLFTVLLFLAKLLAGILTGSVSGKGTEKLPGAQHPVWTGGGQNRFDQSGGIQKQHHILPKHPGPGANQNV